jgi:nitrous oxide reductase accessory protein NosL
MGTSRRGFLKELSGAGFVLSPIAAALTACGRGSDLPEGMVETVWDRDTCVRCSMVISDRRFGAQVKGGPKQQSFKFDDIGCVFFWLRDQPWGGEDATRIWVVDSGDKRWIDARKAHYVSGKTSPMGYNYAAVSTPQAGSVDFVDVRAQILALDK